MTSGAVTRVAVVAALAAACGDSIRKTEPGPLDTFFYPTGLGILGDKIVVASSNADLTYSSDTGGSLIVANVCEPWPACADSISGATNLPSFSGQVGVADPARCAALGTAGPFVIVPIRGSDLVYRFTADASGALACDGCEAGVGSRDHGDPFAVGIACGPGLARAFVGFLRSSGNAWITQLDLQKNPGEEGYVRIRQIEGGGQVRAFAYDERIKRLYFTRTATSAETQLRWVDLASGCLFDVSPGADPQGCSDGFSKLDELPDGLELRGIALANERATIQRAYLTARIYDAAAAALAGGRVGDFDGLLLVVDLWEDLTGTLRIDMVDQIPIGYGAGDVRVLPARTGKRDVVVALASDDGVLWIYDDDTGGRVAIGRDPATGAPIVGHDTGLAVRPEAPGGIARVYVGSFRENHVTPIDVPLDAPETAAPVTSNGVIRRIGPRIGGAP
ncbi:MAG TPA: hypothetical protein VFL83_04925 [Anaeromyxobacter sp.]|nr:hypothetical protein [Anaeromyxobacter sp.]